MRCNSRLAVALTACGFLIGFNYPLFAEQPDAPPVAPPEQAAPAEPDAPGSSDEPVEANPFVVDTEPEAVDVAADANVDADADAAILEAADAEPENPKEEDADQPVADAPVAEAPIAEPEPHDCSHGTALQFAKSVDAAAATAKQENKLVLVMHISGNLELEEFT